VMCLVANCTNVAPEPTLPCDACRDLFGDFMQPSSFAPISVEQVEANEAAVREIFRARREMTGEG
jgi:cytidine deaminase